MRVLGFIMAGLLLLLFFRVWFFFSSVAPLTDGQALSFPSTLTRDATVEGSLQKLSVFTNQGTRIFITTSRFPTFHYGQELLIEGEVEKVHLEDGSFLYLMDFPSIEITKEHGNILYQVAYFFRVHVVSVFERTLVYPYAGLLIGIVFGIREGMPEMLTDALIHTGVIHITAASGMNVTLVGGAIFAIFSSFLHRKWAVFLSVSVIWMYALISGFDASITRASLMASIAFSASFFGRQNVGWYALFLTGFVMVFISPHILYDIGFQLSFASTAGILFLVPLMGRHTASSPTTPDGSLWFLTDDLKTTVSAQIATVPILFSQFGEVSLFSVLVNLFILWTIPFLMILGGIASLVGLVSPILSVPFLYLSYPLLWFIETVVLVSASLIPSVRFESFPLSFVISYYFIVCSIVLFLYRRRTQ